jgi:hypothetical protein
MRLNKQPRHRLALIVAAQAMKALRQGKLNEVEAYDVISWAAHAVATHDTAGLEWRVEFFRSVHGIAPDLGKAQA